MFCSCCRRRKDIGEEHAIGSKKGDAILKNKKVNSDDYLRCDVCETAPFSPDGLEKHREGKRHKKVIANADVTETFSWVRRPQEFNDNLSNDNTKLLAQGRPIATELTAVSQSKDEKGWQRVGHAVKMPSQQLVYLVGERNILHGCLNVSEFLSTGAETKVLQYLETVIEAAIKGRLRGMTYQSKHKPSSQGVESASAQLSFGCAQDWVNAKVISNGKVEPVPPTLKDIARRISARSDVLEVDSADEPDCLAVFDLREGDFLPPSNISSSRSESGFVGPLYIISLCSSNEDILIGGTRPLDTPGEFAALYAHRLSRRGLLKLDAGAPAFAVPRVKGRLVLLIFRKLSKEMKDDQLARGNVL
jgi:hypothetical protein